MVNEIMTLTDENRFFTMPHASFSVQVLLISFGIHLASNYFYVYYTTQLYHCKVKHNASNPMPNAPLASLLSLFFIDVYGTELHPASTQKGERHSLSPFFG